MIPLTVNGGTRNLCLRRRRVVWGRQLACGRLFDSRGGSGKVSHDAGRRRLVQLHYWLTWLFVHGGTRDTICCVRCPFCWGELVDGGGDG